MKLRTLSFAILLAGAPSAAQDVDKAFTLNVNVDLVQLHVSVVDEQQRPVGGLVKDHFRVLENNVAQSIAVFKQEDIPVSLGLVIDNSRSIEPRKQRLDAAAVSFVRKSNPEDETFIVHFDSEVRLVQDFTSDLWQIQKTLASAKPFGQTAVYDALARALDQMERAKYDKKALLLVTDGIDNASTTTLSQITERLKRDNVMVFVVGLLSESGGLTAEESLIRIADASGGKAYFPENVEQARVMMERIARDLREQYTLGYFPTNPNRDGAWRSVRVEVKPPQGYPSNLIAHYRHGYYGPKD